MVNVLYALAHLAGSKLCAVLDADNVLASLKVLDSLPGHHRIQHTYGPRSQGVITCEGRYEWRKQQRILDSWGRISRSAS